MCIRDSTRADHHAEAAQAIADRRPSLVFGSPPCADWCSLNARVDHPRMEPAEVERRRGEARAHLEFAAQLYEAQLARGARFL
eukprot:3445413-Alexandrium_andersonii.AAC.1